MEQNLTREAFISQMKEGIAELEKGGTFTLDLHKKVSLFANKHYGKINSSLLEGVILEINLYNATEEEEQSFLPAPIPEGMKDGKI